MELPPYAIPVDVIRRDRQFIKTSKMSTLLTTNKKEKNKVWYQRAPEHLEHIIGAITIRMTETAVQHLINPNSHFEIASDGGHEPHSGISTFGWVVAVNKTIIATGKGPAQAHPSMAESFRSEGYGLVSACLFLHNMMRHFNITIPEQHQWTIYIDNKSLIQRLNSFRTRTNIPRWNLRPDEDICKVAAHLLRKLPACLKHIKSHQDKNQHIDKLPFEAVLNTMADKEATMQRQRMHEPDSNVNIIGAAQLRIENVTITRDSQRWLLHQAGRIPILQYYKERFGWEESTFERISWKTQLAVLHKYNQDDQTRITKFVHGWLPTQHRKFKEGTAKSPRCLLCASLMEDNIHLLHCTHKDLRNLQYKIQQHLLNQLQDNGDSEMINIISIGFAESISNPKWQPDSNYISPHWAEGVRDQNRIGWRQIYYGRIAKTLIGAFEQHYRDLKANEFTHNGERWARQLIRTIWDTILEIWHQRNSINNQADAKQKESQRKEKLENRVRRCFSFREKLRHGERQQWFANTLEEVLKKDARFIESWTKAVERIISITKREQKKRPRESIIMERFINLGTAAQTSITGNTPAQRTTNKPSKFIQEMNPD
jgi:hypothetical protein